MREVRRKLWHVTLQDFESPCSPSKDVDRSLGQRALSTISKEAFNQQFHNKSARSKAVLMGPLHCTEHFMLLGGAHLQECQVGIDGVSS
jgi:hypothetical protein